jgi:Zn-dependent peptidase ImmA (M78 family)
MNLIKNCLINKGGDFVDLLERIIKKTNPKLYNNIEKEVLLFQKKHSGARGKVLQDDIFRIIEELNGLDLLLFPVKDEEFCGFICEYKGENFIYINTDLPLAKQIFAAAHELYHYINNGHRELLQSKIIDENEEDKIELEESKANLFAALLLVPDDSLKKELELLKIKTENDINQLKLIKLMDIFAVPYKTIVLRLFEIDLLNEEETKKWLSIPDRSKNQGILNQIKKHKIGERWQKRTREVKYSNLQALIYDNDEFELLPKIKIKKDLAFIQQDDQNE